MRLLVIILFVTNIILQPSLALNKDYTFFYDLKSPTKKIILPDILFEVSGISLINEQELACVQDEKGIIFIYSLKENKIVKEYRFHADGDYEGIAFLQNDVYILRSDGYIYELMDYNTKSSKTKSYNVTLPALNNEGLCYDGFGKKLLIASKSKFTDKKEAKLKRAIYSFDLKSKKVDTNPVFEILLSDIQKFIEKNKISQPKKFKKDGSPKKQSVKFRPSAIAIHPISRELYLLSAAEHFLYIFTLDGQIKHIEPLNQDLFQKAEGITFDPKGNLYISNEGKKSKPTILMFKSK